MLKKSRMAALKAAKPGWWTFHDIVFLKDHRRRSIKFRFGA